MKTTKKALLLTICALLMVAASVLGTMAYLTSRDNVVNTFTVGAVKITLDEAKVAADGTPVTPAARVKANSYHLLPGRTYTKDPTVHVDNGSENCWLFVKVENGIEAIEDSTNTIAAQLTKNGWTAVTGTTNVYAYSRAVSKGENIRVFDTFGISGNVDAATLANYANAAVTVTAYAVQADGFATAEAAWTAANFQ